MAYTPDLSAFILTQNNIHTIKACLDSLTWCTSVIVIDSFSTDGTLEIVRNYSNTKVYQHQYTTAREQRIWGMQYVVTKWVFIIDSDEYCPEKLRNKIIEILKSNNDAHDGYLFFTRTYFMGKLLTHRDYLSSYGKRLVLTSIATRYWRKTRVHASIQLDHKKYINKSYYLIHDPIRSFSLLTIKMSRYAKWQAEDMYENGKVVVWWHIFLRPIGKFLRHYILYGGFRDGLQGLIICLLGGWSVCLKFLFLMEIYENEKNR